MACVECDVRAPPAIQPGSSPALRLERLSHNKNNNMSDPVTPGAPAPAAPAEAPSAASPGATQPFGSFGANRGSGLLRGKAKRPSAAPAASAAPSGYQPSSIEVITPKSEYVNPFTGETSVASPVSNEPAPAAPAPVAAAPAAPAPVAAAPAPAPQADLFPLESAGNEEKAELNILPPAETKRPAQSWEANGQGRSEERPTFRPERRERREFQPRESRENRPAREASSEAQPRAEREPRIERTETPKKSGGFLAWLKGLFGGSDATTASTNGHGGESRRDGEYRHGRRRHRGGRGRHQGGAQGFSGPRDGQNAEGGRPHQGDSHQGEGGGHRRRRRGGRNRHRGDRGGEPRSDGHQGGGAI